MSDQHRDYLRARLDGYEKDPDLGAAWVRWIIDVAKTSLDELDAAELEAKRQRDLQILDLANEKVLTGIAEYERDTAREDAARWREALDNLTAQWNDERHRRAVAEDAIALAKNVSPVTPPTGSEQFRHGYECGAEDQRTAILDAFDE